MEERSSPIQKGEKAPDFTLKDQNGDDFNLTAAKGKRVLLSFHPLAWTNICAKQMQSLEANTDTFASLNVIPVGISIDSVPTKKAWAETLHIKITRLLSDFWKYQRTSTSAKLIERVEANHYSTFALYSSGEMEKATAGFVQRIESKINGGHWIHWFDENILFVIRKEG